MGWAIAFAPKIQIWVQRDIGTIWNPIHFSRVKNFSLPVPCVLQAEILNYPQGIILSGMYLKHHCSTRVYAQVQDPAKILSRHSLESSPKGSSVSFLSRTKERLIFSLRTPLWQGDIHFRILLMVFESSPWHRGCNLFRREKRWMFNT